jgi:galactose-1-phosphate uridylyltransferase
MRYGKKFFLELREMEFKTVKERFEFFNPMNDMKKDTQIVEYRTDPLTGTTCIYNPATAEKARLFYGPTDRAALRKFAEQTKELCFFCPEKLAASAAQFIDFGTLQRGEAVLFPNLYAAYHDAAVIVLTKTHFLDLNEFTPQIFSDAISLGLEYVQRRYEEKKITYGVLGGNYLPPAGASIVHPHMHVLSSKTPFRVLQAMIDRAESYYRDHGVNIIDEILTAEERYIGKMGGIDLYTPFAPLGNNEIDGVIRTHSLLDLTKKEIDDVASVLVNVLNWYYDEGLSSYNFMLYGGALDGSDTLYCGIKIISRQNFSPFYINDMWYLLKILQESLIFESPEKTAERVREAVQRKE